MSGSRLYCLSSVVGSVSGIPCLRSGMRLSMILRMALELSHVAFISPEVL